MDLWKMRPSARPGLVLSPQGLSLETAGWGVLQVPWSAIQAIESRSFEGFALRYRGRQSIAFDNVTMIRLPTGFLHAERAAGRFVPKGPAVDWVVRPDAEGDWIALHHEPYSLTPAEVRAPVETRWQAFHGSDSPDPASLPPLRLGGFRPKNPPLFRAGTAVGLVAILIVLSNIAGLWQTQEQARARAWAAQLEEMRARDRQLHREAEERHKRMLERFSQPGFPFNR
jgi:hypothetical protein